MSYESRAYDEPSDFGPEPVVVLVVTGTHDVSRLVHLFSRGLIEHVSVGKRMQRQVRRHNGGRAALKLLRDHGGPDFTAEPDGAELEQQRAQTRAAIDAVLAKPRRRRRPIETVHLPEDGAL